MANLSRSDHDLLIRISERMDQHENSERELKEALELMARDLAESGQGAHDVETPFAWTAEEADEAASHGPTIDEYFEGLLTWEPRDTL